MTKASLGNGGRSLRVAIVGGGISGMATAYYLHQEARARGLNVDIHLLEASDRLGGVIHTVREHGFIVEGGPDCILSFKPAGVGLWKELGLEADIVGTSREHRGSYIYSRGALHPLPEGLTLMIPSKLGPLFRTRLVSWPGKLRAGLDLIWSRHSDGRDVSVAEFVTAHLGQEVFERIVEPLFAGIYAGDARHLSLAATYPQLLEVEQRHGSLLRGLLLMQQQRRKSNGRERAPRYTPFVTLRAGLAQMVEALQSRLDRVDVHLRTRVRAITRDNEGSPPQWRLIVDGGSPILADAVVIAAPAHASAAMLRPTDPELADTLARIPYASTVTVSLAFPRAEIAHPLNGYGFVVPRVEGRRLLACTWTSGKFPHRAPAGWALFRCFLGRAGDDDVVHLSDERLTALVLEELRAIMGVEAVPEHVWVFRWPRALPQYTVGHLERLRAVEERLKSWPGLFLVGNAYRGVGVPDRIAEAKEVAKHVLAGHAL